jgi:N-acetylmuramic acid 6-phosphate etherase
MSNGRPIDRGHLPTEQALPEADRLDTLPIPEIVGLMHAQDRRAIDAVGRVLPQVAAAAAVVADRLGRGGRLVYFGAGTSGRLGVLDASECPPTFRSDPGQVRGVIAGGDEAMFRAQEGAEDDEAAGVAQVDALELGGLDVAFGIAAGGTTPFVRGALARAGSLGSATVFLACVPPGDGQADADIEIRPITGPEVVAGSTRLKAGTVTKLVLNQVTTAAFVRLGKTLGSRMVDLKAGNAKLRDRATRLTAELCALDRESAADLLLAAQGHVKTAVLMHARGVDRDTAIRQLDRFGGHLRAALDAGD